MTSVAAVLRLKKMRVNYSKQDMMAKQILTVRWRLFGIQKNVQAALQTVLLTVGFTSH